MSDYILALDQGTTSSRAILFDREGNVRASANQEFHQHYPKPGWVEHDAEEIWQSQLAVTRRVLLESGARARDVAAIGITNQRETVSRPRPRDRLFERLSHSALQPPHPRLGQGNPRLLPDPFLAPARSPVFERSPGRDRAIRLTRPDCGCGGRPAGVALRPPVLSSGRRKEHLRHGLLPADERGK